MKKDFDGVTQPFVHDFVVGAVILHFLKSFVEIFDRFRVSLLTAKAKLR